jgi:hypothetical protein
MKQNDIEKAIVVQKHQADRASGKLSELEGQRKKVSDTEKENRNELDELDAKMAQMFKELGIDRSQLNLEGVQSKVKLENSEMAEIEKKLYKFEPLETIEYTNWEEYKEKVNLYIDKYDIDLSIDPIAQMLTHQEFFQIEQKYKQQFEKYKWDKWDYVFVGSAGIIAAITDYFLAAIPKTMTSGVYKDQKGSVITEWLQNLKLPPALQKWLEDISKVPYDNTGGADHRADTFGHDPVLGFIIGTIDIMRGGATTLKGGKIGIQSGLANPVLNPLEALVTQFLHLVSDVATRRGLPVPFASVFRALNLGSFPRPDGKTATINQLALWMYHYGYDLRHFVTMAITPATIEIILRLYLMIRHYAEEGETKFFLASNPKYRSMLLSAHAIATAGNVGKIALMQGNPLAINYAEWMALFRYLLPSMKYWLFDKHKEINKIYETRWEELVQDSQRLYDFASSNKIEMITLGTS